MIFPSKKNKAAVKRQPIWGPLLAVALVPFLIPILPSAVHADVEFVVDCSVSMAAREGSFSRLQVVRNVLEQQLVQQSLGQRVALRVFGHRVDVSDKEASCRDGQLLLPFGQYDKNQVAAALQQLKTRGLTPLAAALKQLPADFGVEETGPEPLGRSPKRVVVVLSDGRETCGGNPAAEIAALMQRGFKVNLYLLGLELDANADQQLRDVAAAAHGFFICLDKVAEVEAVLQNVWQREQLLGSRLDFPPDAGSGAVRIVADQRYTINFAAATGWRRYFFEGRLGEKYLITLKSVTGRWTVKIGAGQTSLVSESLVASAAKNEIQSDVFRVDRQGRYYIDIFATACGYRGCAAEWQLVKQSG